MEGEIKNLTNACLLALASLSYCYLVLSTIPKGKFRLLSLLPVIYIFTIIPLLFSYVFPRAFASFFLSWSANFKLLLFAFDQGPLSSDPHMSLVKFITIACIPIKIKQSKNYPSPKDLIIPLNYPTKLLLLTILVGVHDHKVHLHPKAVLILYCCMAYLLVDLILDACNYVANALLNVEKEPTSNEPYFSTSLQDFWGRRWNLLVANILRHTIYKPVKSSLETKIGQCAPLPAVLATFLVSGLMHELLYYHITRVSPTWEVTLFFVLQGVCLVIEFGLKLLASKLQLYWAVSVLLTVGFVMVTSFWLFLPQLVRNGSIERGVEEYKMVLTFLKGMQKLI